MTNSKVISVRLHPSYETEGLALEIFEALTNQFSPREIITDALLRLNGITPEMFREKGIKVNGIREVLDDLEVIKEELAAIRTEHAEQMRELLRKFKAADPDAFKAFAEEEDADTEDLELDEDFVRNAQMAMRKSYRQERG